MSSEHSDILTLQVIREANDSGETQRLGIVIDPIKTLLVFESKVSLSIGLFSVVVLRCLQDNESVNTTVLLNMVSNKFGHTIKQHLLDLGADLKSLNNSHQLVNYLLNRVFKLKKSTEQARKAYFVTTDDIRQIINTQSIPDSILEPENKQENNLHVDWFVNHMGLYRTNNPETSSHQSDVSEPSADKPEPFTSGHISISRSVAVETHDHELADFLQEVSACHMQYIKNVRDQSHVDRSITHSQFMTYRTDEAMRVTSASYPMKALWGLGDVEGMKVTDIVDLVADKAGFSDVDRKAFVEDQHALINRILVDPRNNVELRYVSGYRDGRSIMLSIHSAVETRQNAKGKHTFTGSQVVLHEMLPGVSSLLRHQPSHSSDDEITATVRQIQGTTWTGTGIQVTPITADLTAPTPSSFTISLAFDQQNPQSFSNLIEGTVSLENSIIGEIATIEARFSAVVTDPNRIHLEYEAMKPGENPAPLSRRRTGVIMLDIHKDEGTQVSHMTGGYTGYGYISDRTSVGTIENLQETKQKRKI